MRGVLCHSGVVLVTNNRNQARTYWSLHADVPSQQVTHLLLDALAQYINSDRHETIKCL